MTAKDRSHLPDVPESQMRNAVSDFSEPQLRNAVSQFTDEELAAELYARRFFTAAAAVRQDSALRAARADWWAVQRAMETEPSAPPVRLGRRLESDELHRSGIVFR